ncbi:copper resistance protein CopD [Halorubrum sp. DM2]|uniref:copper resistance protein CopD n=1 Tax=Halorubrum sp. DM2 TaxID=2527867 RepID=UPI0024B7893E|nr:copper resistance protein CopD [Halorubrum sp. DM2]
MIRTVAYAVHVLSGAFWTGAVLFVVYAVLPRATDGDLSRESFADAAHRLLMVTRWTGVALPVTGAYLVWVFYRPLELLTGTSRGWAVLAMLSLWGVMNGLVELGILRMRREVDSDVGWGTYMAEGFPTEALDGAADAPGTARLATVARPYLLASAGLAVLLLVDAALLAGGIPG